MASKRGMDSQVEVVQIDGLVSSILRLESLGQKKEGGVKLLTFFKINIEGKCEAEHPQNSWLCSDVFLIDICMLRTNLKVLSGANE